MPRKARAFPKYPDKPHSSNQARVYFQGKEYYLGIFNSPESHAKYKQLIASLQSGGPVKLPDGLPTVSDVVAAWNQHVPQTYKPESKEPVQIRLALAPLDRLFGPTLARDFDADALETVRDAMASGSWMTPAEKKFRQKSGRATQWAQSHINHSVNRIRGVWRWAERKKLVPKGSWENLRTLRALDGRDNVRTTTPRKAVEWSHVEKTLPHLTTVVRAMVQVIWWSGCRPAEVCRMKRHEIDMTGDVWIFRPTLHKNKWRNAEAIRAIPKEAQTAILPWILAAEPEGYVFPPQKSRHGYYSTGFNQAVKRACKLAGVPVWSPYSLRHASKRRIKEQFGSDAARIFLGHTSVEMTEKYDKGQDVNAIINIARKAS